MVDLLVISHCESDFFVFEILVNLKLCLTAGASFTLFDFNPYSLAERSLITAIELELGWIIKADKGSDQILRDLIFQVILIFLIDPETFIIFFIASMGSYIDQVSSTILFGLPTLLLDLDLEVARLHWIEAPTTFFFRSFLIPDPDVEH